MKTKVNHFQKSHTINSWLNLIISTVIVVCVFLCVVANLLADPTEIIQEVGIKTFRMFTILSNMFVGVTAAMSIPFAVDGIRQKNYHLPRWIVNLTFTSTTCITLTFTITLLILSPRAGFILMMATNTNLFLHTVVPLSAILSFLFINTYHTVKFRTTFFAMLPILAYSIAYLVLAIIIGEDRGGWRDHYHFESLMPWYFVFIIILLLSFGIANLLKAVHNRMHQHDKAATEAYYQSAPDYDFPTIDEAIAKLAADNKKYDASGEVIVPRRIIKILENRYQSKQPLSCLCRVYLEEYMK